MRSGKGRDEKWKRKRKGKGGEEERNVVRGKG